MLLKSALMRKLTAFLCILFCFVEGKAQKSYSPIQYKRVEEAGKVWGHIKYLHPYIQQQSINWDSAFAYSVPFFLQSKSKEDYTTQLRKWLSLLGDPQTRLISSNTPSTGKDTSSYPIATWKDSVLVVSIKSLQGFGDFNKVLNRLEALIPLVSKARGVLFDLRPVDQGKPGDLGFEDLFAYSGIEPYLTDTLIQKPALRKLAYTGFPPEDELSGSPYYPYYITKTGAVVYPKLLRKCPVVFLVNENIQLPSIALSLQACRRAVVLNEGDFLNVKEISLSHYLPDSVLLKIRVAEIIDATGAPLEHFRKMEPQEKDSNQNKALSLLKSFSHAFNEAKPTGNPTRGKPNAASVDYHPTLYPSVGYRALSAAKIFSVIDYFFPYKQLMEQSWDSVYHQLLPQFIQAKDSAAYSLAVAKMYRFIQDNHGIIDGPYTWKNQFYSGSFSPSVYAKMVQGKLVVYQIMNDSASRKEGIAVGDIIEQINGVPVAKLLETLRHYQAASTGNYQDLLLTRNILCGKEGESKRLTIRKSDGRLKTVKVTCSARFSENFRQRQRMLNHWPIFKLIDAVTGYVDLGRLRGEMIDSMLTTFKSTKAIIMDMRGYPRGTAWMLAPRLTDKKSWRAAVVSFKRVEGPHLNALDAPQERENISSGFQVLSGTDKDRYKGKTIMLINEEANSEAEHSGLLFKTANNTTFVGSPSAGANGNVTHFKIPGQLNLYFSGCAISWPNGKQLQRVGLQPDIFVVPTIKGLRQGKDEVLDRAVQFLKTNK